MATKLLAEQVLDPGEFWVRAHLSINASISGCYLSYHKYLVLLPFKLVTSMWVTAVHNQWDKAENWNDEEVIFCFTLRMLPRACFSFFMPLIILQI